MFPPPRFLLRPVGRSWPAICCNHWGFHRKRSDSAPNNVVGGVHFPVGVVVTGDGRQYHGRQRVNIREYITGRIDKTVEQIKEVREVNLRPGQSLRSKVTGKLVPAMVSGGPYRSTPTIGKWPV